MVLQKIEVQATFEDQLTAGLNKAIKQTEAYQVVVEALAKSFQKLNRSQSAAAKNIDKIVDAATKAGSALSEVLGVQAKSLVDFEKQAADSLAVITEAKKEAAKPAPAPPAPPAPPQPPQGPLPPFFPRPIPKDEQLKPDDVMKDEIRARIQNALDTMVEFGASVQDVEKALKKLNNTQKDGIKGTAQQANVLRTLVDESENAEFALKNMERATELATKAGIKLEDAGRQLGMAFRGETQILQNFDKAAKDAASAIDDITDPALRSKAIMIALEQATRRQNSALQRLSNQFKMVGAVAPNFVKAVRFAAKAFVGLGAAITGVATKALKSYLEGTEKMRKSTESMKKTLKDLEFTFGAMVAEAIGLGDGFKGAEKEAKGLTKFLKDNRVPITQSMRDIALAGILAGQAITMPFKGIMLIFASASDIVTEFIKGVSVLAEGLLKLFVIIAKAQGKLKGKLGFEITPDELKNIEKANESIKQLEETRKNVEPFARTTALTNSFNAAGEVIDKFEKLLKTPVKFFDIGKRDDKGGKKAKGALLMPGGLSPEDVEDSVKRYEQAVAAQEAFEASQTAAAAATRDLQSAMAQGMPALDGVSSKLRHQIELTRQQVELQRKLAAGYREVSGQVQQFTRGALAMAIDASSQLFESLTAGEFSLANFGRNLLNTTADLLGQMGQAFILMGSGIESIKTGILSPGALIAIGVGMIALSGAMKGFAAKGDTASAGGGAGAGGGTAAALERFGRRIFERGDADQGREVTINIEGRSMRGFVLDVAADGARRGSVPLTPRRV
jgi:hypothetical protein